MTAYTQFRINVKNFEYGIVPCSVSIKGVDGTFRPYYIELLSGVNTGYGCPVKIWAENDTVVCEDSNGIVDINETRLQIYWGRVEDGEEDILTIDMFIEE